ncbi:LysM-like peptidoglycan-binding domain-containing protein [Vibrio sp. LaRot3]|uniref:LysM-like peptidoglycan-binding domain-containing protein n=1 Tax=Vibrio sp. LaRot3 TaxID=2998829 RepID=UPI0022CDD88E|nr:LysM-like peptidoglycan-binding domain-containing protein [Vibrio sp. LaRot3]MDA0149513.1 lysine transporter LysM [Vibrio sp. LaRot3]
MNRRKKKPQQVDYLELIKQKWSSIDWKQLKSQAQEKWSGLPKPHQRALMVLVPVVLLLALIPFPQSQPEQQQQAPAQRVEIAINTQSLSEQGEKAQHELQSEQWQEYQVKKGDTLAQVFRANELPMKDLNALVKVEGSDKPLSNIRAGQLVRFKLANDGKLDILQLEKSSSSVMFFRLSDGGFGRSK